MPRRNVITLVALVLAVAVGLAACSGDEPAPVAKAAPAAPAVCAAKIRAEYQKLANRVKSPVYCPTWMPSPLDGDIKGPWENGVSVKPDRSYLVSFLWHEPPSQDVHVNLRGYPGRAKIPVCEDTQVVAGKVLRKDIPCFSDAREARSIGRFTVTPYTVNQGVDMWHVLYLWRENGGIYTLSEHVAKPLTYQHVVKNLDRMLRGLVRVEPTA